MSGRVLGRLQVVRRHAHNIGNGMAAWFCVCSCGNTTVVAGVSLRSGATRSCGCLFLEKNTTHNLYHSSPLYRRWDSMRSRCYNPNHKSYKNYGGRGVTVCRRWGKFENFHNDMISGYRPGLTLDRKNNDGNYSPSNCRWATWVEQMANKRPVRSI